MTDSAQNILMWGIIALVAVGSLAYQLLKDADTRFASELQDVVHAYRVGFDAILRNRWLVMLPVILNAVDFLLDFARRARILNSMSPSMHEFLVNHGLMVMMGRPFNLLLKKKLLEGLIDAPGHLMEAYYGILYKFANVNSTLLLALLILAAWFPFIFRRLKIDTDLSEARWEILGGQVFKINFIVFVIDYIVMWASYMHVGHLTDHSPVNYCMYLLKDFISLSVVSLLEGWFLISVWMTLQRNGTNPSPTLQVAMVRFKPLYLFNLLWVGVYILMRESDRITTVLVRHSTTYAHSGILHGFNAFAFPWYLAPWLEFATACMPFLITSDEISLHQAWRRNTSFIQNNWPGYLTFMVSGMILWLIPSVLHRTFSDVLNPLSFIRGDIELLLGILEVLLMTWFFVSIYGWFWKQNQRRPEGRSVLLNPLLSVKIPEPWFARANRLREKGATPTSKERRLASHSVCPHCGAPNEPDSNFCDQCGVGLSS